MQSQVFVFFLTLLEALTAFGSPQATQSFPKPKPAAEESKAQINKQNNTRDNVQEDTKTSVPRAPERKAPTEQSGGTNTDSHPPKHETDTQQSVEWWMVRLTFGLVIVGGVQTWVLKRQTGIINDSLRVAQGSLVELRKYVSLTEALSASTKETADATKASIDMMIGKERARIRVDLDSLEWQVSPTIGMGAAHNGVSYRLRNEGPTQPTIDEAKARAVLSESDDFCPDYQRCGVIPHDRAGSGARFFAMLEPDAVLMQANIMKMKEAGATVHFYGYVKYRDIFERKRETWFCYRWHEARGGIFTNLVNDEWERCGHPDANRQT